MNRTEQRVDEPHRSTALSLFEQALQIFNGWTDPDTGARVLRLHARNVPHTPGMWRTFYHQFHPFLHSGQTVLLHTKKLYADADGPATYALNLATGEATNRIPDGYHVTDVMDKTQFALLNFKEADGIRIVLWDLRAGRELSSVYPDGWKYNVCAFLSDGRRALVFYFRGKPYDEPVQSRFYLLEPGEPARLVYDVDGYFCSHLVGHPTDPNLYSFDRWPSPMRPIVQAITLRTVDGSFEEPLKLDAQAMRSGDTWGCRDHYLWTPDGARVISYLCPHPIDLGPGFNHFKLEWWLSALDWRTGEDLAARYPRGRFGGHMAVTPDSRYAVCCGGSGFDNLFAVEIEGLRQGWNEHIICAYPHNDSKGTNADPHPQPFVLPDGSGVIFNAGWHGDDYGVYLAEWPATLK